MERPKIGELLVAAGVIGPDVLETALEKQRAQGGGRLGGLPSYLRRVGTVSKKVDSRELPVDSKPRAAGPQFFWWRRM